MASEDIGSLVVRIEANMKNFEDNIDKMSKKAKGFGDVVNNALSFAGGLGIVKGVEKIVDGLTAGVKMGVEFDSTMQQNKIAFESMLGSASKADDLLGKLSKMAASTPFEFPQLTTAAKKMLAFGFSAEKIPDMMTKIGDAAAGLGLGAEGVDRLTIAIGQMGAKGKIQAGEMMQLTEAGVPAWDILAKAMGKSTAEVMKMSEQGLIPADKAIQQLIDGMESRFPGMMDKQSKSFAGLMSTLKDNVQMAFGKVLEPAFNFMTNTILPGLIAKTSAFTDALMKGGLLGGIKALFPPEEQGTINNITTTISNFASSVMPVLQQGFKIFTDTIMPAYINAFKEVSDIVIPKLITIFTNLYNVAMPPLQRIFEVFINDVLPRFSDMFMYFIKNVYPIILDAFNYIITNVLPPLIKIFEYIATEIVPMLAKKFQEWMPTIVNIVKGLWEGIKLYIDYLVGVFNAAWPTIKDVVTVSVNMIAGVIGGLLQILNGLIDFIVGVFTGNWERAWNGVKEIFSGIWDSIGSVLKGGLNYIIAGINTFIRGLNQLKIPDWVPEFGGMGINIPNIPYLAKGTNNFAGGLAIVGEKGPELVNLPGGSDVIPNDKTQQMLGQTINYDGMFKGAIFNVRSDADIKSLAREIYNLQQQRSRASGVIAAT